jgi:hypothetical protein
MSSGPSGPMRTCCSSFTPSRPPSAPLPGSGDSPPQASPARRANGRALPRGAAPRSMRRNRSAGSSTSRSNRGGGRAPPSVDRTTARTRRPRPPPPSRSRRRQHPLRTGTTRRRASPPPHLRRMRSRRPVRRRRSRADSLTRRECAGLPTRTARRRAAWCMRRLPGSVTHPPMVRSRSTRLCAKSRALTTICSRGRNMLPRSPTRPPHTYCTGPAGWCRS